MDLVKSLEEDKLIQPGKFLFTPSSEAVTFFMYLHTLVEKIVKRWPLKDALIKTYSSIAWKF